MNVIENRKEIGTNCRFRV